MPSLWGASFAIRAVVIDQVDCHGSSQIKKYIVPMDFPLQRAVMAGVFLGVSVLLNSSTVTFDMLMTSSVRGCLDNFAVT